jgi:hypothetical protein
LNVEESVVTGRPAVTSVEDRTTTVFLSNMLSSAVSVAAYERGKITARNAQQVEMRIGRDVILYEVDKREDERRTIEENLRKWKQHLDDHAREPPREHVEKVAREWMEGIRPSMPAWRVGIGVNRQRATSAVWMTSHRAV